MSLTNTLTIIIGALLTLFILSFVYKDTILFRIAEYTVIGAGVGHTIVIQTETLKSYPLATKPHLIIPIIIGLLLFTQYIMSFRWLSRYPTSILIAIGTALLMRSILFSDVIKQIDATISVPLNVNTLLVMIGTITVIYYFVFAYTPKSGSALTISDNVAKLGTWFMMIAFGATFGQEMLSRVVFLIARITFLKDVLTGIAFA